MKFWEEFKLMSMWKKVGAISAVLGIVAFGISLIPSTPTPSQQQTINGNGNTQIGSVMGSVNLNQTTTQPRDPQESAQAIRVATESFRQIARMHMPNPPPRDWARAENLYNLGRDNYAKQDYHGAFKSFSSAGKIYQDLYSQALSEGH